MKAGKRLMQSIRRPDYLLNLAEGSDKVNLLGGSGMCWAEYQSVSQDRNVVSFTW